MAMALRRMSLRRNSVTGDAPDDVKYIVQTADARLPNAQALDAFGVGTILKVIAAGVLAAALGGTDYVVPTGVAGGQTVTGGTAAGESLTLVSTSNGTRGPIAVTATAINLTGTTAATLALATSSRNFSISLDDTSAVTTLVPHTLAAGLAFGTASGLGAWNSTALTIASGISLASAATGSTDFTVSGPASGTGRIIVKTAASGGVQLRSPTSDGTSGTAGCWFSVTDALMVLGTSNVTLTFDRSNALLSFGASGSFIAATVNGSSSASGNLTLQSTTNATKGKVIASDVFQVPAGGSTNCSVQVAGAANTGVYFTTTAGVFVANGVTVASYSSSGVFDFQGQITLANGTNIAGATSTGSKLGTNANQKWGFWGVTPVVQQVLATGAGATVDNVITMLQTIGACKQA